MVIMMPLTKPEIDSAGQIIKGLRFFPGYDLHIIKDIMKWHFRDETQNILFIYVHKNELVLRYRDTKGKWVNVALSKLTEESLTLSPKTTTHNQVFKTIIKNITTRPDMIHLDETQINFLQERILEQPCFRNRRHIEFFPPQQLEISPTFSKDAPIQPIKSKVNSFSSTNSSHSSQRVINNIPENPTKSVQNIPRKRVAVSRTSDHQKLLTELNKHLQTLHRKANLRGKLHEKIIQHKVELTKALIQFVKNQTYKNWTQVRSAMNSKPQYAFSWTGRSKTDDLLNRVRISYAHQIQAADSEYNNKNPQHAKNSWDQFFYHLGLLNYIFAIPEGLCLFVTNFVSEIRMLSIGHHLYQLKQQVENSNKDDNEFTSQLKSLIEDLHYYLIDAHDGDIQSDSRYPKTREDIRSNISHFTGHLSLLFENVSQNDPKYFFYTELQTCYAKITGLVGVPDPASSPQNANRLGKYSPFS